VLLAGGNWADQGGKRANGNPREIERSQLHEMKSMRSDNVFGFYAHWESEEKEKEDPERHRGSVRCSTYEIPVLMARRITAFAGIATSEAVLRKECGVGAQQLAGQLRLQGFNAPGKLGLARG